MTKNEHEPTKVGMLGAGFILASHARSVAAVPGCTLDVIADASEGRRAAAMREFGFVQGFASIEAMAASGSDSVHVLLPPTLHESAVRTMLQAGKAVFVEKPFVLSSAAALELAETAEAHHVALGVNHNFLFGSSYEELRALVRSGGLGRICDIAVEWHYPLPFIKHGPFDNWIVSHPVNPLFEIAAHPLAFVLDLLGSFEVDHAEARDHVALPSGVDMPRRWRVLGHRGSASVSLSLAFGPGHESRSLTLRGEGGAVRYDFGRDIAVLERTRSDNPMLDAYQVAQAAGAMLLKQSRANLLRRIKAALRKNAGSSPFEESIARSIRTFYQQVGGIPDPRHSPRFAAETIRLAEVIASRAGLGTPGTERLVVTVPKPDRPSTVLVVGGTGFIGRALVKRLLADGHGVRVLTRSASSAPFALRNLPVEIVSGHHGDEACVREALAGIEVVYHLAKCEGRKWQDYLDGDVAPTRVLGRLAES